MCLLIVFCVKHGTKIRCQPTRRWSEEGKKKNREVNRRIKWEMKTGCKVNVCKTFLLERTILMCARMCVCVFFSATKCYHYHSNRKTKHALIRMICFKIYGFCVAMQISINILNTKMFIATATCIVFYILSRQSFQHLMVFCSGYFVWKKNSI